MPSEKHSFHGRAIAEFAAGSISRPLPDDVREKAGAHILDTLASIVSGSALPAGRAGALFARGSRGDRMASMLGTAEQASVSDAAFANGMAAHADETDDTHERSLVHPGCGILPAALAVAEAYARPGVELQRAVVLGYDMAARFAEAVGAGMSPFRSSLATHSFGNVFGAGFATASLLRFSAELFSNLLSYLAQEASGITTWTLDKEHVLKSYVFAGMPASCAVRAARCVELGFPGGGDVLDLTRRNMLQALTSSPSPASLVDGLGSRSPIMEADIKSHAVGYPIIAPVVAVERLLAEAGPLDTGEIKRIRVRYHKDWYTVVGASQMPSVNIKYCLAATLLDGHLTQAAAHDARRMNSPEVRDLMSRVELLEPVGHFPKYRVRIEVDLGHDVLIGEQGGEGGAESSMTTSQVEEKARFLMRPILGDDRTDRVIAMVAQLDQLADVNVLTKELTHR